MAAPMSRPMVACQCGVCMQVPGIYMCECAMGNAGDYRKHIEESYLLPARSRFAPGAAALAVVPPGLRDQRVFEVTRESIHSELLARASAQFHDFRFRGWLC